MSAETSLDEPRKQRIEERIGGLQTEIDEFLAEMRREMRILRWICGLNIAVNFMILVIVIRLAFGG